MRLLSALPGRKKVLKNEFEVEVGSALPADVDAPYMRTFIIPFLLRHSNTKMHHVGNTKQPSIRLFGIVWDLTAFYSDIEQSACRQQTVDSLNHMIATQFVALQSG